MTSALTLAVGALVLYGARGNVGNTLWVYLNLLDSLRALKYVRRNGRRIGIATRRDNIRRCVVCWIVLVAVQPILILADLFLSWIPFYMSFKTLFVLACLTWRLPTSAFILQTVVIPVVRRYEDDIDLALSLIESTAQILLHYCIWLPWHALLSLAGTLQLTLLVRTPHSVPSITPERPPPVVSLSNRSSSEDKSDVSPRRRVPKTPSKPPKKVKSDAGLRSTSDLPIGKHPLRSRKAEETDTASKVLKAPAGRLPRLPTSQSTRVPSGSEVHGSKRSATTDMAAKATRRKVESKTATRVAASQKPPPSAAARRAAATAALKALPHPPSGIVGDPGDSAGQRSGDATSVRRRQVARQKRRREGEAATATTRTTAQQRAPPRSRTEGVGTRTRPRRPEQPAAETTERPAKRARRATPRKTG